MKRRPAEISVTTLHYWNSYSVGYRHFALFSYCQKYNIFFRYIWTAIPNKSRIGVSNSIIFSSLAPHTSGARATPHIYSPLIDDGLNTAFWRNNQCLAEYSFKTAHIFNPNGAWRTIYEACQTPWDARGVWPESKCTHHADRMTNADRFR